MPSDAQNFEDDFETLKEFVDDEGNHFYAIQFKDGSGRFFRKKQSEDGKSITEFVIRDESAMQCMRKIASTTDFTVNEGANTQQNLRNLLKEK